MGVRIYRHTEDVLQAQRLQSGGFPLHPKLSRRGACTPQTRSPSPGARCCQSSHPGSAGTDRAGVSLGAEEPHALFCWDSQIRPPVPCPALSPASTSPVGARPAQPQPPRAGPRPGASWAGAGAEGWDVQGDECMCACECVCIYRSTYIYTRIYIYIKYFPCPWRGAFAAAVRMDQVGHPELPTFSKPAYKSTSICSSKRSISDFYI